MRSRDKVTQAVIMAAHSYPKAAQWSTRLGHRNTCCRAAHLSTIHSRARCKGSRPIYDRNANPMVKRRSVYSPTHPDWV